MNAIDKLRSLITEIVNGNPDQHRTLGGEYIPFGCQQCVDDLETRISDAAERRDSLVHRSDARTHYNGLLKVLRRDLRAARKVQDSK